MLNKAQPIRTPQFVILLAQRYRARRPLRISLSWNSTPEGGGGAKHFKRLAMYSVVEKRTVGATARE